MNGNDSAAKKLKPLESEETKNILNEFEFVEILNDSSESRLMIIKAVKKTKNVEGNKENSDVQNAVIIFSKPHFSLDETKSFLEIDNPFEIDISNDIYKKLCIYPLKPFNNVQVQLIYPATEQHIKKYSMQEHFFIQETYQDWLDITSKFINQTELNLEWVYNILEHKSEKERIIYEDEDPNNGFILLPDMKWDGKVVENLYALAIVRQKNLPSLRSLDGSHIGLLENIRDKCVKALQDKYGIKKEKLRSYLHYQPSFYHLHVHFTHMNFKAPGIPERNHALNQVIENLKIDSDYYKKATLEFVIKKNEKLYELYKHKFESD